MRVYQLAEELSEEIDKILAMLPYAARKLANHLEKSNESLGLNLMEGLTVFKPKVKASCFDITRKETGEVRKVLRRIVRRKFIAQQLTHRADGLANAMIGAMTNMIKQQEAREDQ
ncbi:MAG TPA: four helix bundle protein [Longimicrobiales bacterium]|nr:four helix bundle protein [Longimicrobiales bacterium]